MKAGGLTILVVTGLAGTYFFETTVDLTTYLQPGDMVEIGGNKYTIATDKFFTSTSFFVTSQVTNDYLFEHIF